MLTMETNRYNKDTTNYLSLSLQNSGDAKSSISAAPDCAGTFISHIIDGCDGDPINNPKNYKFGGVYATSDGWTFSMIALAEQTNENSCDAKLGHNGLGLLAQLRGCGIVTNWSFQLTPNDVKYHWYANGRLPIGTRACVGRAVQAAGGTSAGNCVGAG
jgi:hypothetical protein